MLPFYPTEGLP